MHTEEHQQRQTCLKLKLLPVPPLHGNPGIPLDLLLSQRPIARKMTSLGNHPFGGFYKKEKEKKNNSILFFPYSEFIFFPPRSH